MLAAVLVTDEAHGTVGVACHRRKENIVFEFQRHNQPPSFFYILA
jgi:hypothetical protein